MTNAEIQRALEAIERKQQALVERIGNDLHELAETRAESVAGQAQLSGKIDTLNATVSATNARHADELRVLFAKNRDTDDKVNQVLLTYVTRSDFEGHVTLDRRQKDSLNDKVDGIRWKVAMVSGALSLISFLAGFALKAFEVFK